MSDYIKNGSGDELDAILNEVRNRQSLLDSEAEAPSKTWSIDDIDRLIAETNGEEYVPPVREEKSSSQSLESILGDEFDAGLFTIRPMGEERKAAEMQDISSSSGDAEVDGQETFEEEFFDESIFDIEKAVRPAELSAYYYLLAKDTSRYLTALNSGKIGITIEDGRTVSGS